MTKTCMPLKLQKVVSLLALKSTLLAASIGVMTFTTGCGILVRQTYPAPNYSATLSGVKAPVDIYMDALGVPHIFAQNDEDVAFSIGFLHGRDRRFQVELLRMASQGRLTELLGKELLDTDRRLRLLSLNIDEALQKTSAADKARIETYCAGLNAAAASQPLPLELKLRGFKPAPWTPRDVLLIGRFQAWDLSSDAELEGLRDIIATRVPSETLLWMTTPSMHFGVPIMDSDDVRRYRPALPIVPSPPPGLPLHDAKGRAVSTMASTTDGEGAAKNAVDLAAVAGDSVGDLNVSHGPTSTTKRADAGFTEFDTNRKKKTADNDRSLADDSLTTLATQWVEDWLDNPLGGSNGWAISGKHSSNGKPILAGDPHLDLPWPPIFYEVHFHTPEVDVSGSTFPGMPMVVIGRAANVAWTLTTSYADTQDLYRLTPAPSPADGYMLDGHVEAYQKVPQTYTWGEKPDQSVTEDILVSRFGPVYNRGRENKLLPNTTYALSWPGFSGEALPITTAFDKLYRAKEPSEVQAAVAMLPIPSQNWIFATETGHIGYVLGGKIPNRRASPLPRDGSTQASAWTDFLPEAERPMLVDPPSGFVVASNQPIYSDVSRLNTYGSGGYRALRIQTALESHAAWSAQEVRGLQVDAVNLEAARLVPLLKAAFEAYYPKSLAPERLERVSLMASQLFKWDAVMRAETADALIYESWRQHVHRRLFATYLPETALLERYLTSRLSEAAMEVALFSSTGQAWWDRPSTPKVEVRDEVLVQALLDAEEELSTRLGKDASAWKWGTVHTLTPKHPYAKKSVLKPIFGTPSNPMRGGRHTLIALNHDGVIGNYEISSGAAMRQVVQFDAEKGYILAGGNAGQPHHPFALNQLDDWMAGGQHVAGGEEATLKANAVSSLHFKP